MSEEEVTTQFSPVIFRSPYASMKFQVQVGFDKKDEPIHEEWQFTNGVFVCDTQEKLNIMEAYLEERGKKQPHILAYFVRTDRESALKLASEHIAQNRRENAAIAGPFQADHMVSRSIETAGHMALKENPAANDPNTAAAVTTGLGALLARQPISKVEENTTETVSVPE